ncbi:DUF4625 domain-containing protein [Flammeovirga sp. EKP202]|uniref:DUF4625 domain-containing protein n=1 Tax=Flammeovirga sp. EKP202 TaxID=2770592 RepID=UPI00165F46FB|nr:DUF4625 domain-containing protein [Flammeovirga sp. EKP202]MBD0401406.1 DUF4625 domain-containing protein [Flammeovirga sp. EKP202]
MKKLKLIYVALILTLISCNQDDELSKLSIENFKYGRGTTGHGDNQIGYAGVDLHLEAQVNGGEVASEVIVTVESLTDTSAATYDYSRYYEGRRNTFIHEHPIIPTYFDTGLYHIELTVIDKKGDKAIESGELLIVPIIRFLDIELEGSITPNEQVGISFRLEGLNILKEMTIQLVDANDNEILSNFYDFSSANTTVIDFKDSMLIPSDLPSGEYYVKAIASDIRQNTVINIFNF